MPGSSLTLARKYAFDLERRDFDEAVAECAMSRLDLQARAD